MVLNSVVYPCVLIILVTAGQMAAEVASDKVWGFLYVYVFFNYRLLSLPFRYFRYRLKCFLKEPFSPGICVKILNKIKKERKKTEKLGYTAALLMPTV